jgi:hypothetical protein
MNACQTTADDLPAQAAGARKWSDLLPFGRHDSACIRFCLNKNIGFSTAEKILTEGRRAGNKKIKCLI